jgi:predicted nuclease of restriction endonuclease-like (RecB) superfamily
VNKKKVVKKISKKTATAAVAIKDYAQTLQDLKKRIKEAQIKATMSANKELIKLYWHIGKTIAERQKESAWGSSVIERLAGDLQKEFPGLGGFSRANIFRMQAFHSAYEKIAQAARQLEELPFFNIPWFHNVIIIQKLKNDKERLWYAKKAIENGWSRTILEMQIESSLHRRQSKAITNFSKTLPAPQSDMAKQSLKDPYLFDFLTLRDDYIEHDLEQGLIDHIQQFLLELGQGFAFVGRQKHLEIGKTDFYIDLLFYHISLRCYVVVELKNTAFKPEYAGQLNFYLSAVDDLLRVPDDKPTIGLLLCKTKDNVVAEYALRDINKPIGVAGFETKIIKNLPKNLKSSLPTIEEIEAELEKKEILSRACATANVKNKKE